MKILYTYFLLGNILLSTLLFSMQKEPLPALGSLDDNLIKLIGYQLIISLYNEGGELHTPIAHLLSFARTCKFFNKNLTDPIFWKSIFSFLNESKKDFAKLHQFHYQIPYIKIASHLFSLSFTRDLWIEQYSCLKILTEKAYCISSSDLDTFYTVTPFFIDNDVIKKEKMSTEGIYSLICNFSCNAAHRIDNALMNQIERTRTSKHISSAPDWKVIRTGNVEKTSALLNAVSPTFIISFKDSIGMNPLMCAMYLPPTEAALTLIKKLLKIFSNGGALNIVDNAGFSALHHAMVAHNFSALALLLQEGANPYINTPYSPLLYAARQGFKNSLSILLNNGVNPLYLDTYTWDSYVMSLIKTRPFLPAYLEIIKLFLDKCPALINVPNREGMTPLTETIVSKLEKTLATELIKLLLAYKPDLLIKDAAGKGAEHHATANVDTATYLLLQDYKKNNLSLSFSQQKVNALCQAINLEDNATVNTLIDEGVSVNGRHSLSHITPLGIALNLKNEHCIAALLKAGAYPYLAFTTPNDFPTAMAHSSLTIVKMVLEKLVTYGEMHKELAHAVRQLIVRDDIPNTSEILAYLQNY